jgi:hypothetical protein
MKGGVFLRCITKETLKWLNEHNFYWCERLPYSNEKGWSNGRFSVIYEEEETENLESIKRRFEFHNAHLS